MVRLSPENSPQGWTDILEDIETLQRKYALAEGFSEVTGLSILDREYIESLSEEEWMHILEEATMIAKSELEVKQTVEGLAKAVADLENEDDPAKFEELIRALEAPIRQGAGYFEQKRLKKEDQV